MYPIYDNVYAFWTVHEFLAVEMICMVSSNMTPDVHQERFVWALDLLHVGVVTMSRVRVSSY